MSPLAAITKLSALSIFITSVPVQIDVPYVCRHNGSKMRRSDTSCGDQTTDSSPSDCLRSWMHPAFIRLGRMRIHRARFRTDRPALGTAALSKDLLLLLDFVHVLEDKFENTTSVPPSDLFATYLRHRPSTPTFDTFPPSPTLRYSLLQLQICQTYRNKKSFDLSSSPSLITSSQTSTKYPIQ